MMRVRPNVAWLERDGSVYALPLPATRPIILSGTAALIWACIVDGVDPVATLADEFGMEPDQIESDVVGAIDQLVAGGLVDEEVSP